ncbi:GNAT family acetyltransferase [Lysinibacillus sp. NPDC094177]|uniref:GNAT family acetyltransferase n=1 Tax=Lysinibacillus sp. NPDC094177 TaxID=3390580 RepID=UPI003D04226D
MVTTKNLANHLEVTEIKMFESRLNAIKEIQNNAMGVEVGKFDGAYAFAIKNIPGPSYNVVKGDSFSSENTIEKILSFYRAREIPARFDLAPQYANATSLQKLHNAGLYQSDFHATLYCELNEEMVGKIKDSPIKIRQMNEAEFDRYGNIYVEGFGQK